ncbi:hypothetical protein GCM10010245_15270 [Streptomyces spectabilis]|nr:hypothetical protein GCM10010245_15270 [Streptomyces spectabilis]
MFLRSRTAARVSAPVVIASPANAAGQVPRIQCFCVTMSTPESGDRPPVFGRGAAGRTGERWAALAVSQGAERL